MSSGFLFLTIEAGRENASVVHDKGCLLYTSHACAEDLPFADNSFDIVYHIGGINFFNDKAKAMQEMLRVAKPGTKLLIADETADYVDQQYKKNHFSKDYFCLLYTSRCV